MRFPIAKKPSKHSRRLSIRFAWLPVKTKTAWLWLERYRQEEYYWNRWRKFKPRKLEEIEP